MKTISQIKDNKRKMLRLKKLEATSPRPQRNNFDKGRLGVKTNERALGS